MTASYCVAESFEFPFCEDSMNVTAEVEDIGPAEAKAYLAKNGTNRPLSETHVGWLAGQMAAGQWRMTGEAIILDTTGQLLNGQHRLHAVLRADARFPFMIVRGVAPSAFRVLDTGKPRSISDILSMNSAINTKWLAAVLSLVYLYENDRMQTGAKIAGFTAQIAMELLKKHPDIPKVVSWSRRIGRIMPPSVSGFCAYMILSSKPIKGAEFLVALADGTDIKGASPLHLLRRRLERRSGIGTSGMIRGDEIIALTIKAWNATASGSNLAVLKWTKEEKFPRFK